MAAMLLWRPLGAAPVLAFALVLMSATTHQAQAKGLTCTKVPADGGVTASPIACTVDCSSGGTIAAAIALKPHTTNLLTITINGTCVEAVDDLPGGITLQAGKSGASLQAPSASTDPVLGISGRGVTLTGLTIAGGVDALMGHQGAAFTGTNLLIEGGSAADVNLDDAATTIDTSTIENSAGDGIDVGNDSHLALNGGSVRNNKGFGVKATSDGSAHVYGGAVLQNNGIAGVNVDKAASLDMTAGRVIGNGFGSGGLAGIDVSGGQAVVNGSSSSVSNNNNIGIFVYDNGSVVVENEATVANNSGTGILVLQGGFAKVQLGASVSGSKFDGIHVESGNVFLGENIASGQAMIENNNGNGVFLRTNSVAVFDSPANQIINNTGWGIFCTGAPSNPLIYTEVGSFGTVSGNKAGQISCKASP